jgi:hypothetical protein
MHFMSIEVTAHRFLFKPSNPTAGSSSFDEFLSAMECDEGMAETKVPFSHNHLHDLESLWWVAVWVVFYHSFSDGKTFRDPLTLQDANDQLDLAEKLFPPMVDSFSRQNNFQDAESYWEICNQLPAYKKVAYFGLAYLREQLIKHYTAIEANYPLINPNASTDDIYHDFTERFTYLKTEYEGFALKPIEDIHAELLPKSESKRPRSESTVDPGVAQKSQRK